MAEILYAALLEPLGLQRLEAHERPDGTGWLVFGTGAPASPFFVVAAGRATFWQDGHRPAHLAFRAPWREAVDAFPAAEFRLGASNNGGPGMRRQPYYGAFLVDPDGNNLEAGLDLPLAATESEAGA